MASFQIVFRILIEGGLVISDTQQVVGERGIGLQLHRLVQAGQRLIENPSDNRTSLPRTRFSFLDEQASKVDQRCCRQSV